MSVASPEYIGSLPDIYRDILATFPAVVPSRYFGWGLAVQTIFIELKEKWSMKQIIEACEKMEHGGAVKMENRFFVHPTPLGEEIIAALVGQMAPPEPEVPEFPIPK